MHALVGSGEYLPGMEPVDTHLMAQLGEPARVVCLPTGAGTEGEARIRYWMDLGVDYFSRLGAAVSAEAVTDHASANNPDLADAVRAANFVYLSGGKPSYLHASLAGTLVWQAVEAVLAEGGILAGCSAGAMVQGSAIWDFPGTVPGFGFVPNALIVPHFDEIPGILTRVMPLLGRGHTVIGIDGFTALVKNGTGYEVLGRGSVTIFTDDGPQKLTAGPVPADLLAA